MLPFFARTLTRREMALGCAVLSLALLLSTLPAALRWGQAQLDTGALLCADTLRFHIRADSDSPADQTAKLAVRDAVLAYADVHCTAQDKPAALRWAAENLPALELTARAVLARRGIFSTVTVQLVEMYFDTTRYSTGILPAGRYQALRIDLGGNARHGKNWWCVLYPGLCRSACGTYALPEENDLVCGGYVVRFKCVEWWQRVTASREDKVLVETASPSQARSKDGEGKNAMAHLPTALHTLSWKECDHNGDPRLLFVDPKGLLRPGRSSGADLAERRDQCSYYPALTIDGHFGTRSENAVKEFQLRNSMNMDGKVGANTWNALYAKYTAKHGLAVPYPGIVMRTGMSGGTIRLIQQKLNTLGEKIGTDGKFGSRTAAAVQRFQRRNGLNADGAVGKATWEKLFPAS